MMKKEFVYKSIQDFGLKLKVYYPALWKKGDQRPAILFFFGGGWIHGNPDQFRSQSEYLASKGMVAITAEYRVFDRHETTPIESVEDGKAAIAWVRSHADELGIDAARIAVGGGSAGGHVALSAAVVPGFIDENEESLSRPDLLVLFNPVVDTTETGFRNKAIQLIPGREKEISPIHHVKPGTPDTLIFHGTEDEAVPISRIEQFCQVMADAANSCRVISFEGAGHGFFNREPGYQATLQHMEQFLREKGYIESQ